MTRLWCALATISLLFTVSLLLMIQGTAWNGQAFLEALESPECSLPCYMGIQAGVTTGSVAYARLQTHPWVTDLEGVYGTAEALNESRDAMFMWRWNGREPLLLHSPFLDGGQVDVQTGVVRSIKLRTGIPLGVVWLSLGRPAYGFTRPSKNYLGRFANQLAYYPERGLLVQSLVVYPLNVNDFWNQPVDLILTATTPNGGSYEAPCWMRCDE